MAAVRQSHSVPPSSASFSFRDEDERAAFEERAAIREFDAGLPRVAAERLAWGELLTTRSAGAKVAPSSDRVPA